MKKTTTIRMIVSLFFIASLIGAFMTQNESHTVILFIVLFVLFTSLAMQHVWRDKK